jgi:hypothetical protein
MGTHSVLSMAAKEIDLTVGKICEAGEEGDQ